MEPINRILKAIRDEQITEHGGVAAVAAVNPRLRRSNAQILLDKERELVELRKDLAFAQADITMLPSSSGTATTTPTAVRNWWTTT